ncbi:hypothetical protein [Streptosporangium sp. NPDC002721]|uniref:hypothetical protein n=1 Tax=Streptosporangium sp. NPDC002721 TaxID=3366188 RepID=UPI0036AD7A8F
MVSIADRAGVAARVRTGISGENPPRRLSNTVDPAAGLGMAGAPRPALIGATGMTSLIAVLPEGGAEAIASRGRGPGHDEPLDHAAMELGTD